MFSRPGGRGKAHVSRGLMKLQKAYAPAKARPAVKMQFGKFLGCNFLFSAFPVSAYSMGCFYRSDMRLETDTDL
jgi:hypothetical protein